MVEDASQAEGSIAVDAEGNEEAAPPKRVFNDEMHEKVSSALHIALKDDDPTVPF